MEIYVERKRERRIRDARRMRKRAERWTVWWWSAEGIDPFRRNHPADWNELFAERRRFARRYANNMKKCTCWLCASGRRLRGEPSVQEYRGGMAAVEQLIDAGYIDDCAAVRRMRWRINWI